MSLASRIAILFLLTVSVATTSFVWRVVDEVKPRYREAVEEPLVDIAHALAAIVASDFPGLDAGHAQAELTSRSWHSALSALESAPVSARIYGTHKEKVDLRVYVTDTQGTVLFHSFDKSAVGKDFSAWNDVLKTLRGEYGARTTRDREDDANSSVLYVGAPIVTEGIIRGVLSVGKPSRSVNTLVAEVTSELWKGTIVALACLGALTLLLSVWITQPLRVLTSYARKVRDGEHVSLPSLGGREAQELGVAFEEMRLALEGKKYVEHYVQTLTHEIKSPLSSIRGAAELLAEETIDEKSRAKFLGNISSEVRRLQSLVDRLLFLASLERMERVPHTNDIDLAALVQSSVESMEAYAESKGVTLKLVVDAKVFLRGDKLLLGQGISNLLKNAIEFSPEGGSVEIRLLEETQGSARWACVNVRDYGSGVPQFALEKVFHRFFSLPRPNSGVKSSGLGLSIVKSIAELHLGTVTLENMADRGAKATLRIPATTDK